MQFKKADLIDRIDERIPSIETNNEKLLAAQRNAQAEALARWHEKERPRFLLFVGYISQTIEQNGVLTAEDLEKWRDANRDPRNYRTYSNFFDRIGLHEWTPDTSRPAGIRDTSELEALKKMLEAITDDTVSSSALQKLGFTKISSLFRED